MTMIVSAIWLSWTFVQVNPNKRELIVKQVLTILIAAIIGLYISYNWTIFHYLGYE